MTDREALNEFTRGASFVIGVMAVFALIIAMFSTTDQEPKEKFAVVDTYKGCDVVRYTDRSNDWHYLLDCHDTTDRN